MPAYTFFAETIPPIGAAFTPDSNEQSHIKVMKIRPGDEAWFIDGRGKRALGRFEGGTGPNALWQVLQCTETPKDPERRIMIPWMRGAKLDWIIEKVVEFGVNRIQLFPAEKSEEIRPKLERLSLIIKSAVKQCGTLWLPQIEEVGPVKQWKVKDYPLPLFFGSLRHETVRLPGLLLPPHWIWCAGPEAGWTDKEEAHLLSLGGTPVSLSKNILRAETAAIGGVACLTALQADQ